MLVCRTVCLLAKVNCLDFTWPVYYLLLIVLNHLQEIR